MESIEFERRLRALAKRHGLTFATFATLPDADREVLVATIVDGLDAGRVYREKEINAILKQWLATAGAMVGTDHVHIRRWLVDTGVVTRTSDCAEYRLGPAAPSSPEGIDAVALVATIRQAQSDAREARKAEWLARTDGAAAKAIDGESVRSR